MKTPDERGPLGAWAQKAREDADLSIEEVIERLTRRGHPLTAATLRGVEGGSKKPGRRLVRQLASVYGSTPPADVTVVEDDALVAALTRQSAAIEALVAELGQAREGRQRLDELDALVRSLAERLQDGQGSGAPGGLALPRATTG